jgi:hypothetical protein
MMIVYIVYCIVPSTYVRKGTQDPLLKTSLNRSILVLCVKYMGEMEWVNH